MSEQTNRSSPSGFLWGFIAFIVVTLLANNFLTDLLPPPPPPKEEEIPTQNQPSNPEVVDNNTPGDNSTKKTPEVTTTDQNTQVAQDQIKKREEKKSKESFDLVSITLEDETREIILSNQGAAVTSAILKVNDASGIRGRPLEVLSPFNEMMPHFAFDIDLYKKYFITNNWEVISKSSDQVVFRLSHDSGLVVTKTFSLKPNYMLDVNVDLSFQGQQQPFYMTLYGPCGLTEDPSAYTPDYHAEGHIWAQRKAARGAYLDISFGDLKSRLEDNKPNVFFDDQELGASNMPLNWLGCRSKYLVALMRPSERDDNNKAFLRALAKDQQSDPQKIAIALSKNVASFDRELEFHSEVYLGPRHEGTLKKIDEDLLQTFKGGMLGPIKFVMLTIVEFFYRVFNSYGLAIILLTLCVRVAIHPITRKSQAKMQQYAESMTTLKPKLDALKKKFGNDRQAFAQAQMKLMREHNITGGMLGGCLPMLLQFPIFIALYIMLQELIELRGTTFLWIADLSQPDKLFEINFIVDYFNILPILNSVVMLYQFKRNSKRQTTLTPEQEMQQKMMFTIMPLMMLVMFYSFPSGLFLYWITSALVGIIELEMIRNKMKKTQASPIKVKVKKT